LIKVVVMSAFAMCWVLRWYFIW